MTSIVYPVVIRGFEMFLAVVCTPEGETVWTTTRWSRDSAQRAADAFLGGRVVA